MSASGGLAVQPVSASASATGAYTYKHLAGAASTLIKTGAGTLHGVVLNTPAVSGSLTLYDGTSAAGAVIAIITLPATLAGEGPAAALYDVAFTTGLFAVVAAALDITLSYI